MAGITLDIAQAHLDAWLQNDLKLASGQRVVIDGVDITRVEAQAKIEFWDRKVKALSGVGSPSINTGIITRRNWP
jgi:hypothetical protein